MAQRRILYSDNDQLDIAEYSSGPNNDNDPLLASNSIARSLPAKLTFPTRLHDIFKKEKLSPTPSDGEFTQLELIEVEPSVAPLASPGNSSSPQTRANNLITRNQDNSIRNNYSHGENDLRTIPRDRPTSPHRSRRSKNSCSAEDEQLLREYDQPRLQRLQIESPQRRKQVNIKAEQIQNKFKKILYLLLEDPSSSNSAFYVTLFISIMIVVSAVVATVETIPSLYSEESVVWMAREALEIFIVICFTIEFTFRCFAHSNTWEDLKNFIKSPLSWIDLLSFVPYYIELSMNSQNSAAHMSVVFRMTILRMFRLFRIFRVFKHSSLIQLSIEVLIVALKKSLDALSALFFFTVIAIVLFSTLIYFAERGTYDYDKKMFVTKNGSPSRFDSIPSSFWFVIVTLTTTGYGDMVPQTFIGKLLSFPAMMCGILIIALPSIIVGRHFTVVWEHMKTQRSRISGERFESEYHYSAPNSPLDLQFNSQDYFTQRPSGELSLLPHPSNLSPNHECFHSNSDNPHIISHSNQPYSFHNDPFSIDMHELPTNPIQLVDHVQRVLAQSQTHTQALGAALNALKRVLESGEMAANNVDSLGWGRHDGRRGILVDAETEVDGYKERAPRKDKNG